MGLERLVFRGWTSQYEVMHTTSEVIVLLITRVIYINQFEYVCFNIFHPEPMWDVLHPCPRLACHLVPTGGGRFQIRPEFRRHLGGAGHGTRVARNDAAGTGFSATLAAGTCGDVGVVQIQTDTGLVSVVCFGWKRWLNIMWNILLMTR